MRIEGVEHAPAPVHAELEAQRFTARADAFTILGDLFCSHSVLADQMFRGVFTLRRHLRIQLEWLEVQFHLQSFADPCHRSLQ